MHINGTTFVYIVQKIDMKVLFLILTLVVLSHSIVWSQNFTVIAVGGTVKYFANNTWTVVRSGTSIPNGAKIQVADKSYLGLSHINKKVVELKSAGTYEFSNLEKMASSNQTLNDKYYAYVKNQIASGQQVNNLSSTGMVARDLNSLMLLPSHDTYVLEDLSSFVWKSVQRGKKTVYQFSISDMDANILYQNSYSDTFVTVNLSDLKLKPDQCYYWKVYVDNKPSESCFKTLNPAKKQEILDQIQQIEKEFGSSSPMGKVVIAHLLDEQGLKMDALKYYGMASQMAPQVESYKALHNGYMNKVGMRRSGATN
jgi:hypothetical protein